MAGTDASHVFIGTAEQSPTVGAISSGTPIDVTNLPADIDAALALIANFASSGFVSEDGLSMSTDFSTENIREWNGNNVRTVLESFTGELSWSSIQLDEASAKQSYGDENVTVTAATAKHGTQMKIALGAHLPAVKSWAFRMKDGNARIVVFVPRGQVTAVDDISFTATDAISLPTTLSCYDDGTGNSIYVFTDDGVVAGNANPQ